jgi:drug/metabolite transporter (DMT)-like permease
VAELSNAYTRVVADAAAGIRSERGRALAMGAAMVSVVLWASAFVAIRDVRGHLSAGSLALVRLLVGACALAVVMLVRRESLPARRVLPLIALSGLLWFALYNVALNQAEHSLDAGTSSMLVNLGPIGIALLAGWVLREGFPPRLAVGCAVGVAGAVVIGLSTGGHHSRDVTGVLLCVVAAAAYAGEWSPRSRRCAPRPRCR